MEWIEYSHFFYKSLNRKKWKDYSIIREFKWKLGQIKGFGMQLIWNHLFGLFCIVKRHLKYKINSCVDTSKASDMEILTTIWYWFEIIFPTLIPFSLCSWLRKSVGSEYINKKGKIIKYPYNILMVYFVSHVNGWSYHKFN